MEITKYQIGIYGLNYGDFDGVIDYLDRHNVNILPCETRNVGYSYEFCIEVDNNFDIANFKGFLHAINYHPDSLIYVNKLT